MERVSGMVSLGGIPHRIDVYEGMVSFSDRSGMRNTRLTISKCSQPHGLLYVECRDWTGKVPACHIAKAAAMAEHFLGPNHFASIADRHRFERRNAFKNAFKLKTYGVGLRLKWRCWVFGRALWHTYRLWFPPPRPKIQVGRDY